MSQTCGYRSLLHPLPQYTEQFFYFEAMVCVQKVTVSGVLVFLERSPTQQQSLGLIFAGAWSHVYFALSPFANRHDNIIARVSSASLCFILLGALLLPNDAPPTGWRREFGAPLLIAVTAAPIVTVLWGVCVELCPSCFKQAKKEEEEKETEAEEETRFQNVLKSLRDEKIS